MLCFITDCWMNIDHTTPPQQNGRIGPPPAKKQRRIPNFNAMMSKINSLPPFESYVAFYVGPNVDAFATSFAAIGSVPGINCW